MKNIFKFILHFFGVHLWAYSGSIGCYSKGSSRPTIERPLHRHCRICQKVQRNYGDSSMDDWRTMGYTKE